MPPWKSLKNFQLAPIPFAHSYIDPRPQHISNLVLMTKFIYMKNGSLFPKCSSVPAVYFLPKVINLCFWRDSWLLCKLLCRHKQRIMTSAVRISSRSG